MNTTMKTPLEAVIHQLGDVLTLLDHAAHNNAPSPLLDMARRSLLESINDLENIAGS